MKEDNGGWDTSDLEREIDAAVDRLFIEEDIADAPQTEVAQRIPDQQEVPEPDVRPPAPVAAPIGQRVAVAHDVQQKLEEIEAQLLTLEWDIDPKHITRTLNVLQDLRRIIPKGAELEGIVVLIQQVLNQIFLDDSKVTPEGLGFLLKSWQAVKRMHDVRFSYAMDKKALLRQLKGRFEGLGLAEVPSEVVAAVASQALPREKVVPKVVPEEKKVVVEPAVKPSVPGDKIAEAQQLLSRIGKLEYIIQEERRRLSKIEEEITEWKTRLETGREPTEEADSSQPEEGLEEIVDLEERLHVEVEEEIPAPVDEHLPASVVSVTACLFEISGATLGISADQISRSFEVKKWVADFFLKNSKVKLKDREVPLFDFAELFDLEPSDQESRLVILFNDEQGQMGAVLVDQELGQDELECQLVEDKPYLLGKGTIQDREVWVLNVNHIMGQHGA